MESVKGGGTSSSGGPGTTDERANRDSFEFIELLRSENGLEAS